MSNNTALHDLLNGWEEVYKKGQLTFWILLAVRDQPRHMKDIKEFIDQMTQGTFVVDDNSMYRALKRYEKAELISHTLAPGEGGPDRKMLSLTSLGRELLSAFTERNVVGVFYNPEVKKTIKGENRNV